MDVDQYVLALEEPLRALKPLGRFAVEDILSNALDDVFEDEEGDVLEADETPHSTELT